MKVFLGVNDSNHNFINRFLEAYDRSYELTIGIVNSNTYDTPKHSSIINIDFIHRRGIKQNTAIFSEIIKGYDFVVSNNIPTLTLAAKKLNIRCIQYSDLFLYYNTKYDSLNLFGHVSKSLLKSSVLSEHELGLYHLYESYSINPLFFFHPFASVHGREKQFLKPYFKVGTPQEIIENLVISNIASKSMIKPGSRNLSLIDDFCYEKSSLYDDEYYSSIVSSEVIRIDSDPVLLGDCLFNNQRPDIRINNKSVSSYMLYNMARNLNLSKCVDSMPFARFVDENQYNTLDVEIKKILETI